MEKDPDTRSDQECKELLPLVMDFPFMKEYVKMFNDHEMRMVANALEVKKFEQDKRIFCSGDLAEDYYVIARG